MNWSFVELRDVLLQDRDLPGDHAEEMLQRLALARTFADAMDARSRP